MKKIWLFIILLTPLVFYAQNIVPNGDFEIGKKPTAHKQLGNAIGWKAYNTSDLYQETPGCNDCYRGAYAPNVNSCPERLPPNKIYDDNIEAQSGKRFAGFGPCEALTAKLTEQTSCGVYRLSFWYSPRCYNQNIQIQAFILDQDPPGSLSNCSDPGYGVEPFANIDFSSDSILATHVPGNWYFYESDIIGVENGLEWFSMKGKNLLGAPGDPSFIPGDLHHPAYVYIDNIKLTRVDDCERKCEEIQDPEIIGTASNGQMANVVVPNHWLWTTIINGGTEYRFQIYDRWGGLVYEEEGCTPNGWDNHWICWNGQRKGHPVLDLSAGVFAYALIVEGCDGGFELESGSIHLEYPSGPNSSFGEPSLLDCPDTQNYVYETECCLDTLFKNNEAHYGERLFEVDRFVEYHNMYIENYNVKPYTIEAGEYIELLPETTIQTGSNFIAEIKPCTSGGSLGKRIANESPNQKGLLLDEVEATLGIDLSQANLESSESTMYARSEASIHPNPSSGNSQLSLSLYDQGEVTIQIVDNYGQVVQEILTKQALNSGAHEFQLNLSDLAAGIYFCKVQKNREMLTRKIVITR